MCQIFLQISYINVYPRVEYKNACFLVFSSIQDIVFFYLANWIDKEISFFFFLLLKVNVFHAYGHNYSSGLMYFSFYWLENQRPEKAICPGPHSKIELEF